MMRKILLGMLLCAGCSERATPPAPRAVEERPRAQVSARTAVNAQPTDPRVVCPPGTTQKQHRSFGIYSVWCVDADNHRHGPDRSWWSNGHMATDMAYVHGDADGLRRDWHENGRLKFEETYRNGKAEGKAVGWHPNGQKAVESNWRDGVLVGVARRWDKNGRPEPVTEK